ncbi:MULTISPECIES: anthranilate synthase family protein [unclassified Solwaraspora]|uniref:anthranilate synthase family protein n=1 Tax=unclassified Solwaraspora TaxID=2627926 RepID=UPI00259AF40C|nr:anthranilate synthase family protein [Solwaraspora sp. WMMA2056]WJK38489.1 anthranilate synthase family protein [Solwaraspora sp. WMMA2056]
MNDHLSRLLAAVGAGADAGPAATRTDADPGPFALLRRADADQVEVLVGTAQQVDRLADIPVDPGGTTGPATLAVVPYRQLAERGFAHVDDGVPLECIQVSGCQLVPVRDVVAALPDAPVATTVGGFDIDDDAYADLVARVLRDEIGHGAGANFVLHRTYRATLAGPGRAAAIAAGFSALRRLLCDERGAYWTFLVYTGARVLVGATPERHVSVSDGLAMMNPISGTLRHPSGEPDVATLLAFLDDPKEVEELYMVLDEELKMMATVAKHGGQVIGPYLKRMSRLSHTEYLLAGRNCHDVREVLRQTMFAPTVTGSPIENACRVIARYTPGGRRYYAGVLALLGHDDTGAQTMDAPILIRAAEITMDGEVRVPVGATLVRHSTPAGEVAETHAKASAVLASLGLRSGPVVGPTSAGYPAGPAAEAADPADVAAGPVGHAAGTDASPATGVLATLARPEHPDVVRALAARNARLAGFWLDQRAPGALVEPRLRDRDVLVVDAEDSFTGMLAHLLRALGLRVRVAAWDRVDAGALVAAQILVAGPGPGDPRDPAQPRMAALRDIVDAALGRRQPLLGVCLGHQVLADRLGLPVTRRTSPYQGLQREIDFFGVGRRVGFYSSYTATATADRLVTGHGPVRLCRDATDGAVHALVGPGFAGVQFHPESVLSPDGLAILRDLLVALLPTGLPAR